MSARLTAAVISLLAFLLFGAQGTTILIQREDNARLIELLGRCPTCVADINANDFQKPVTPLPVKQKSQGG